MPVLPALLDVEKQAVTIVQFVGTAREFRCFYGGVREFVPANLRNGGLRGIGLPRIGIVTGGY